MPSDHEAVIQRLVDEVYNRGDFGQFEDFFTVDTVDHTPFPGQPAVMQAPGVDGVLATLRMWRSAFPDLEMTRHETTAAGDLVWWRWTATATHAGEILGIPATGETVEMHGLELASFREGKIAERWGYNNFAEMVLHLRVGRGASASGGGTEALGTLPGERAGGIGSG